VPEEKKEEKLEREIFFEKRFEDIREKIENLIIKILGEEIGEDFDKLLDRAVRKIYALRNKMVASMYDIKLMGFDSSEAEVSVVSIVGIKTFRINVRLPTGKTDWFDVELKDNVESMTKEQFLKYKKQAEKIKQEIAPKLYSELCRNLKKKLEECESRLNK